MKKKIVIDPLTFYEKKQSNKEIKSYDKKNDLFNLSLNLKLFQIDLALRKRK